ncbi:hypothetical protein JCM18897A_37790 [Streptomyces sp. JCM 18897]
MLDRESHQRRRTGTLGIVRRVDRWVAIALRTISPALDSDASDEAWAWLHEERAETRRALICSEPCTVTITHADVRITWTIRPVLFLPVAHRQGAELRTCTRSFEPTAQTELQLSLLVQGGSLRPPRAARVQRSAASCQLDTHGWGTTSSPPPTGRVPRPKDHDEVGNKRMAH